VSRHWIIALYLLAAAAMVPGVFRLRIDNSPERFFVHDARALERFRLLEFHFTRDRAVRIVLSGPKLWTREGLAFAGEIEERSQALHGVIGSAGIVRHHRWHFAAWPPPDPERLRGELVDNPVDRGAGWISDDGSTLTVLAGLYRLSPKDRRATLDALEQLAADAPPGVDVRITGLAVVNRELDDALLRMARRFFPALLAVAVLLLAAVFRDVSGVVLPLLLVGICQCVVLGALGYAGHPLDLVLIILVPLLFVIVLATAVHVLCYHRRLRRDGLGPEQATRATYEVKTWPIVWTGATTAVGFGSLAVSGVPPVRALGLWTAFGMAFATVAMLTLFPALLSSVASSVGAGRRARSDHPGPHHLEARTGAFGNALAAAAIARPVVVALLFGSVAVAAVAGLPRLRVETAAVSYLPQGSPLRSELATLERRGIGSVSASLVLHGQGLEAPEALRRLRDLASELRRDPLILGVLSAGDLVADVGAQSAPSSRMAPDRADRPDRPDRPDGATFAAGRARIAEEPELARMLGFLLTSDGRWARITLVLPARGEEVLEPLFDRVEAAARSRFPEAESWLTGQYPLVLASERTLLRTMVVSLSATALCVAVIFRLLLGSLSLTLRALVPNLWPVLVVLGTMGWAGVPIESATVVIASVVLGLAVDDTLHSLGSFRRLAGRLPAGEAAAATLGETAGAHVLTSVTLALGFAVCGLSELVQVARFGRLSAIAILAALVADLVLVPALLARAPRRALDRLTQRTGRSGSR